MRTFYSFLSQPYSEDHTDGRIAAFVLRMTSEDFVEHASAPLTREALIRFLIHMKHAFPDWAFRLEQVMVFPDLSVVVRGVQDGTQKGSYMVSNASDRRVSLPFLAVHHFRDALLTDRWYTLDHLSLLSQLRVHRVYPLDYEFFVPAEMQLSRMKGPDAPANAVEICAPFSQIVAKGIDFSLRVRLVNEKAEGQRVKVVLLDQQGVLLPKYRKKVRRGFFFLNDSVAFRSVCDSMHSGFGSIYCGLALLTIMLSGPQNRHSKARWIRTLVGRKLCSGGHTGLRKLYATYVVIASFIMRSLELFAAEGNTPPPRENICYCSALCDRAEREGVLFGTVSIRDSTRPSAPLKEPPH